MNLTLTKESLFFVRNAESSAYRTSRNNEKKNHFQRAKNPNDSSQTSERELSWNEKMRLIVRGDSARRYVKTSFTTTNLWKNRCCTKDYFREKSSTLYRLHASRGLLSERHTRGEGNFVVFARESHSTENGIDAAMPWRRWQREFIRGTDEWGWRG